MATINDEPPPLEDMSEILQNFKFKKSTSNINNIDKNIETKIESISTTPTISNTNTAANLTSAYNNKTKIESKANEKPKSKGAFSGLAGAFSKNKPSTTINKSTASSIKDDIPLITKKDNSFIFDEVQDAVKKPIANTDWATPKVMEQMMNDPILREGLTNPRVGEVINLMAKDPKKCLELHGNNPDFREFITRFTKMMSNNMTADTPLFKNVEPVTQSTTQTSSVPERVITEEQKRKWMSDPALLSILSDPFTIQMISELTQNPSYFKKYESTPQLKALIRAGIVQNPNVL